MRLRPLDERGLTLTEVTIVAAIGTIVLLGMGGFYLNSQATWLDASAQSITQREITMVTQAIVDSVRTSGEVVGSNNPDVEHGMLTLRKTTGGTAFYYYWWDATDSLVHGGTSPGAPDDHAMMQSVVERFAVSTVGTMVRVDLRARSTAGQRVQFGGSARWRNQP